MTVRSSFSFSKPAVLLLLLSTAAASFAADLPKEPQKLSADEAVDAYLAVIEDDAQTTIRRRYAAAQIMKMHDKAVPRLMALWPSASPERRGVLADLLAVADVKHRSSKLLLDELKRRRAHVHVNVIKALGRMKCTDAVPDLLDLWPTASQELKPLLACALADIGDPRAVDVLFNALGDDNRILRTAGAQGLIAAMRRRKSDRDSETLRGRILKYVESGKSQDARIVLIDGLGKLEDAGSVSTLRRLTRTSPTPVRIAAVKALGDMRCTDAVDDICQVLYAKEPLLRETAASALSAIGDRRCAGALIDQLGTAPPRLRRKFVEALRQVTGQPFGDNPQQWQTWWRQSENR